jgi:hypothetical protein
LKRKPEAEPVVPEKKSTKKRNDERGQGRIAVGERKRAKEGMRRRKQHYFVATTGGNSEGRW